MDDIYNKKFLFSDDKKYRIQRHLMFWGFWGFWFGLSRVLNPVYFVEHGHFSNFFLEMTRSFIILLPQTVLVYPLLYFILPRYVFKGKYFKAALLILVLIFLSILVNAVLLLAIPWHKVIWLTSNYRLFEKSNSPWGKIQIAYLAGIQGSLTGAALAASFKMFKYYYLKNVRNQQLQKENAEAQLQLLKAQVHPHFLFNTLNNIYSQTQLESPKGSKMIMGLSDILRYILYEGQRPLVPLKHELLMITEYIKLEKLRYGNKLDVNVLTPKKVNELYIAPLLLIPFVENCFKHGTSNMLQNPWLNLILELEDNLLVMKLINGKSPTSGSDGNKPGIGIHNVRQRLELLYKDKYNLLISEEEEVFVVDLKVELVRIKEQDIENNTQTQTQIAYA